MLISKYFLRKLQQTFLTFVYFFLTLKSETEVHYKPMYEIFHPRRLNFFSHCHHLHWKQTLFTYKINKLKQFQTENTNTHTKNETRSHYRSTTDFMAVSCLAVLLPNFVSYFFFCCVSQFTFAQTRIKSADVKKCFREIRCGFFFVSARYLYQWRNVLRCYGVFTLCLSSILCENYASFLCIRNTKLRTMVI